MFTKLHGAILFLGFKFNVQLWKESVIVCTLHFQCKLFVLSQTNILAFRIIQIDQKPVTD
jgi:hypothetical protein